MTNFDEENLRLRREYRKIAHDLWTSSDDKSEWESAYEIKRELLERELTVDELSKKKKFYSYRNLADWDEARLASEIDDIEKNQITLVRPRLFNDPYDCRLPYPVALQTLSSLSNETQAQIAKEVVNTELPNLADNAKNLKVQNFLKYRRASFENNPAPQVQRFIEEVREEVFVKCLSTTPNSMYFWSHYASNHQGYCIEYEINENCFREYFHPVEYAEEWPEDYFKLSKRSGAQCAFTLIKSIDWKAELEWRLLSSRDNKQPDIMKNNNQDFIKFAPEGMKITAIYLGLNLFKIIDQKLLTSFECFCKKTDKNIYQMILGDDNFKLKPANKF